MNDVKFSTGFSSSSSSEEDITMKDEELARYAEGFCHVNIIFGPLFFDAHQVLNHLTEARLPSLASTMFENSRHLSGYLNTCRVQLIQISAGRHLPEKQISAGRHLPEKWRVTLGSWLRKALLR